MGRARKVTGTRTAPSTGISRLTPSVEDELLGLTSTQWDLPVTPTAIDFADNTGLHAAMRVFDREARRVISLGGPVSELPASTGGFKVRVRPLSFADGATAYVAHRAEITVTGTGQRTVMANVFNAWPSGGTQVATFNDTVSSGAASDAVLAKIERSAHNAMRTNLSATGLATGFTLTLEPREQYGVTLNSPYTMPVSRNGSSFSYSVSDGGGPLAGSSGALNGSGKKAHSVLVSLKSAGLDAVTATFNVDGMSSGEFKMSWPDYGLGSSMVDTPYRCFWSAPTDLGGGANWRITYTIEGKSGTDLVTAATKDYPSGTSVKEALEFLKRETRIAVEASHTVSEIPL